jgi:hypothetical protein
MSALPALRFTITIFSNDGARPCSQDSLDPELFFLTLFRMTSWNYSSFGHLWNPVGLGALRYGLE